MSSPTPIIDSPLAGQPPQNYDVVFHIGAPKTGSSAIQKFLLEHRQALKTLGFYYPEHGLDENGVSGGHTGFGLNIKKEKLSEAKAVFTAWMDEAGKQELTLLISAESLFFHPEKLKDMVSGLRCKILAFYRSPIDNIFSNYNQSVKRLFSTTTFDQFVEKILAADSDFYSGRLFIKWVELFGKKELIVARYDADLFANLPIQLVFLNMLGIPETAGRSLMPDNIQLVNRSYSPAALELKRLLNQVLDRNDKQNNHQIDVFLQKVSDESGLWKIDITTLLSSEIRGRFIEKYQKPAQQMMEQYLTPIDLIPHETGARDPCNVPASPVESTPLQDIVARLKSERPELFNYLITQTTLAMMNQDSRRSLSELAEMLQIEPGGVPGGVPGG